MRYKAQAIADIVQDGLFEGGIGHAIPFTVKVNLSGSIARNLANVIFELKMAGVSPIFPMVSPTAMQPSSW